MRDNIKSIIFDFDGVILDSLEAKSEAFEELYADYGTSIVKKVRKYHLSNGGVSRQKK